MYTEAQVRAMRSHLTDCYGEDETYGREDREIVQMIEDSYVGGPEQFIRDGE